MSSNDILTEIYQSKELAATIAKVKPTRLQQDIKQHVFLELLTREESVILDLHKRGKLRGYVATMIWNISQLRESNKFTKQIGVREVPTDTFIDVPYETTELFYLPIDRIYWYKAKILELYAELGTYALVAEHTGIPTSSIFRTVREARKEVKSKII